MPPWLQEFLQNKRALAITVGGLVLVVLVLIFIPKGGGEGSNDTGNEKLPEKQRVLADAPNIGQAMEIQALLAQHGIRMEHKAGEGGKTTLSFPEGTTRQQRDLAIITLVQSGLMDKNVGLEAFEKGDLTASREEKRIKLIRSQQGELARLIRKIDPIEDAAVTIAIPEQTLFRSEEKPMSAAVQVSIPVGIMLTRDKVRAISNLMVGSLQGLEAGHVSISDTNGNTYNSVLDAGAEIDNKLQEQDNYMRQKVATQLDRLVGAGNYVVTVSTEMRQAARETMVQEFDPQGAVVSSKQAFNENLNTNGSGPAAGGPASSLLPSSLSTALNGGSSNKDYLRNGVEVTYNNSRKQWVETSPVGMIEDISIAVTIDSGRFPSMSVNELQTLLARAASPKVRPENVTIARSEIQHVNPLTQTARAGEDESQTDMTWIYWAGGAVIACILMILLLSLGKGGGQGSNNEELAYAQRELAQLRDMASQQQAQLQATQQQTQMLLEAQQRQQTQVLQPAVTETQKQISGTSELQQTLAELKEVVTSDDLAEDNLDLQIKSWIESS